MVRQLCQNVTYAPDYRRSAAVRVVDCGGSCLAHLELMDADEVVFAIATCDEDMARHLRDELDRRLAGLPRRR